MNRAVAIRTVFALACCLSSAPVVLGAAARGGSGQVAGEGATLAGEDVSSRSSGVSIDVLVRTLTLRDYNTRIVVGGTTLLGLAAGVIGTFAYLRRRSMLGDALSHATLPGIAIAFLIVQQKSLPVLLFGAAVTGALGVLCVVGMRAIPRIKEDAAIGIVLSVFFGAGAVLLSIVQQSSTGHQAGLQSFIYGKAAALLRQDALLIAGSAVVVIVGCVLFLKEFRLVCFDKSYAAAQGWPVLVIDLAMMGLLVLTAVVGLQAVGLIMVVALLIIPAAAARFWTDRLIVMVVTAGLIGALSGWLGSTISALTPRMPTGAIIVLCAGGVFGLSMVLAPHRGVLAKVVQRVGMARRVQLQHLLRALAEWEEAHGRAAADVSWVLRQRSWSFRQLRFVVERARRGGLVIQDDGVVGLSDRGRVEARRVLRNHRLWELYLIRYAEVAPSHVDRDADELEHVLPEAIVRELKRALAVATAIPPSPHVQEAPR